MLLAKYTNWQKIKWKTFSACKYKYDIKCFWILKIKQYCLKIIGWIWKSKKCTWKLFKLTSLLLLWPSLTYFFDLLWPSLVYFHSLSLTFSHFWIDYSVLLLTFAYLLLHNFVHFYLFSLSFIKVCDSWFAKKSNTIETKLALKNCQSLYCILGQKVTKLNRICAIKLCNQRCVCASQKCLHNFYL